MQKEFIDVDYTEVNDDTDDKKEPVDITVNADPISALFSGVASVVNNVTNSIKEYNMCRQQEETKRATIKAQLKAELAQINAQKEAFLKILEDKHQNDIRNIDNTHQLQMKHIEEMHTLLESAVEMAKQSNDIEILLNFMNAYNQFIELEANVKLQVMDKVYSNNPVGAIESMSPKGYLT